MEWITAVVASVALIFTFFIVATGAPPEDYQKACAKHGGIQQIVGTSLSVKNSTTVVVCKDGKVTEA